MKPDHAQRGGVVPWAICVTSVVLEQDYLFLRGTLGYDILGDGRGGPCERSIWWNQPTHDAGLHGTFGPNLATSRPARL